jgi:hypothetical protein
VSSPKAGGIRELVDSFSGEFANRLEHPVAVAGPAEQALVDERSDCVDVGSTDRFTCLERAAAHEYG